MKASTTLTWGQGAAPQTSETRWRRGEQGRTGHDKQEGRGGEKRGEQGTRWGRRRRRRGNRKEGGERAVRRGGEE